MRTTLALLLALALALPPASLAQPPSAPATPQTAPAPPPSAPEPQPAAPPAEGPSTAKVDLAGAWEGSARLTNDWPGLTCRYEAAPDAAGVHLALASEADRLRGSVAIDLPAEAGSGCPPLRKRYTVDEVATGPATASFTDSGGNEWALSVRRSGGVLQGLLAWREGGPDQPLADGFARPDGVRPLARLSGEVRLRRAGGSAAEAVAPSTGGGATPAPTKTTLGRHARNLAAVIAANAVGIAVLYGVNKVGKGSTSSGALTCSPRWCIVGPPGQQCFCQNPNIVNGGSCGSTASGLPVGDQTCDETTPCQSGLSCNTQGAGSKGTCEDRFGRCPY
jgi:hypothetical protein